MSLEDKRALKIMNETVRKIDGHYQVGLPWRKRSPSIPNNRVFAESRLRSLKRRLLKDENLYRKYSATMNDSFPNTPHVTGCWWVEDPLDLAFTGKRIYLLLILFRQRAYHFPVTTMEISTIVTSDDLGLSSSSHKPSQGMNERIRV